MSARAGGGPAFPSRVLSHHEYVPPTTPYGPATAKPVFIDHVGMSLRDYFAAQALAGIIAKSPYKSGTFSEMKASGDIEARTAAAYDYADAMIAERSK